MVGPPITKDLYIEYDDLRDLPRSVETFRKIDRHPSLSLMLPKPAATAGRVLEHAAEKFTQMLRRNEPCTFKFGITVDPHDRWENYSKYSHDRFEYMMILYAASQPYGPAFLEAALISQFRSFLFAFCCFAAYLTCDVSFWRRRWNFLCFLSPCCCLITECEHTTLDCESEVSRVARMSEVEVRRWGMQRSDRISHTWFTSLTSVLACRSEVQLRSSA